MLDDRLLLKDMYLKKDGTLDLNKFPYGLAADFAL
jgi:hypothetical protein